MRKVVVSEFLSLDGVMENPHWTFPYWSDEIAAFKRDESLATDALLLGRVTYEGFAQAWPNSTDEGAAQMNAMPKYVATTTLTTLTWNAQRIAGNVAEAVAELKRGPGKDLLVYGSGGLVQTLMRHNLVDQYNLLVYPVVIGSGARLFRDADATATLELAETRAFGSGVVALVYRPARPSK